MEEVSAQIASPMFIHQTLSSSYFDATSMAKKRELSYQMSNFQLHQHHSFVQNPKDNWNPKSWDWDSVRFVAKPTDEAANTNVLQFGNPFPEQRKNEPSRNLKIAKAQLEELKKDALEVMDTQKERYAIRAFFSCH